LDNVIREPVALNRHFSSCRRAANGGEGRGKIHQKGSSSLCRGRGGAIALLHLIYRPFSFSIAVIIHSVQSESEKQVI
jgi:hypothetical protein